MLAKPGKIAPLHTLGVVDTQMASSGNQQG